jgi:hypothetical protein
MEDNIAVLGFKIASNNSLTRYNMVDQVIDEYKDADGVILSLVEQVGASAEAGYLAANTYSSSVQTGLAPFDYAGVTGGTLFGANSNHPTWTMIQKGNPPFASANGWERFETWNNSTPTNHTASLYWNNMPTGYNTGVIVDFHEELVDISQIAITTVIYCGAFHDVRIRYSSDNSSWQTLSMVNAISTSLGNGINDTITFADRANGVISMNPAGSCVAESGGMLSGFTPISARYLAYEIGSHGHHGNTSMGMGRFIPSYQKTSTVTTGINNATGNVVSISNTATTAPTTGDLVMLIDDVYTASIINTDIKGYISRDGGTGWDQVTLVDQGTWGSSTKKILSAHDVSFSNSASGTDMKYKLEWANQSYVETAIIQGYDGGTGVAGSTNGYASGGGGGAGGAGIDGTAGSNWGDGGVGRTSSIDGTATFRAAGGGGGPWTGAGGNGGNGGGGQGIQTGSGTAGAANTGSGGGGSGRSSAGGDGGSGIIIIRALTAETSGSTGNWNTTGTDGSHTWYKWTTVTSAGTFTPSQSASYEYLVIAGGGHGQGPQGGGGGAGGYRTGTLTVASAVTGITVGAGALYLPPPANVPIVGDNSVFSTITSLGGGGGAGGDGGAFARPAKDGGSGGGGAGDSVAPTPPGSGTSTTDISGKLTRVHATSLAWKA